MNPRRLAQIFSLTFFDLVLSRAFLSNARLVHVKLRLHFFHERLWSDTTVTCILFAIVAAMIWTWLSGARDGGWPVALRKTVLAFNLAALASFVAVNRLAESIAPIGHKGLFSVLWWGTGLSMLFSSCFVFVTPAAFRRKAGLFFPELLLAAAAAVEFFLYAVFRDRLWVPMSKITTQAVYRTLTALGHPMAEAAANNILRDRFYRIKIVGSCTGLEGMAIFTFMFLAVLMLDRRYYPPLRSALIFAAGLAYMYVLNILRLSLFFGYASWLTRVRGADEASRLGI
ncbi:MAG TPA: hypothetical protein VL404_03380, partial [Candidatus Eisenbacteria bacterium]|nr:hypothetical protein [Candidatus Eisenbacteria bacterium]